MKTHQLTLGGFEKFKREYEEFLSKRPAAVMELKRARELGDLSENAAYKVARQTLSAIDSRIRFLDRLLKNSSIVQNKVHGRVAIGCQVTIKSEGSTKTFMIVDTFEADPANGKISVSSPIGRGLMGKMEGERVFIETPEKKVEYEILKIVT